MNSLLVVGTSHTTDNHQNQVHDGLEAARYAYPNIENGEKTWTQYLCNILNLNIVDLSIGSFGINTYIPRIVSSFKDCQYALLEIPSCGRYEIAIEQNKDYDASYFLDKTFWQNELWKDELYRLTSADAYEDHASKDKFHSVNKNASIKIDSKSLQSFLEVQALAPNVYNEDMIYSNVIAIDGFLKHNNIIPFWFSFNNNNIIQYDYSSINCVNSAIDMLSIKNYMKQNYNLDEDNQDHYADECHMNSVYWRYLVDTMFVKYMREKL